MLWLPSAGSPVILASNHLSLPTQSTSQQNAPAQATEEATTLELNRAVERELAGGGRHTYQIALEEGQYIKIEVRQLGINVGVDFHLPDGRKINQYQPFGDQPVLTFSWVAESSGIYRPVVFASSKAAAGRYEIRLVELRPASENDRALQQARDLFAEYVQLKHGGKFPESRSSLMRALQIRERVLGPESLAVAETLSFLAASYDDAGDYASGEPLHLRVLKIKEKALGPDHPKVAFELAELGASYLEMGDDFRAEEVDRRALGIFEKAQMSDNPAVGSLADMLGNIYYNRGDYAQAENYYERSRVIWEKLFGPDHFHLASSYTHLGRVAYNAGDDAKAEAMFQRALFLAEKGLGQNYPTKITGYLNDLAAVYCTTGDYAKGEALYQRALIVHEQTASMGMPAVQGSLFGLARCSAAQGRAVEAVKLQSQASELEEHYIALNLAAGSEREKLAFLTNLSARFSRNISLHTQLAPHDAAALDLAVTTILQRKGRAQDAMSASLSALRQRFSAEDQKLLDQLNDVTSRLANIVVAAPQKLTPAERLAQIKTLEEEREGLEAEIGHRSAGFYERAQPVTLDRVQRAIPENAALIEFAIYRPFAPTAPDNRQAYGEPHYVVYVLRHQGEVQWKELGDANVIEEAVNRLRQSLRDPQRKDALQLARAVDEKIMQPVRALVGDATQLLISPDGELNLIPFGALVDEQGHYLIERYACTYLTSGRDLLRLQVARESRSQPLVIANPSFGEHVTEQIASATRKTTVSGNKHQSLTNARNLSEVYFAPLSGTEQEAISIQKLFPEASLLTGAQATKSAVEQTVAPRILHIATHGFFLQDARTVAARNSPAQPRNAGANAANENPLLRSGLALAGANLHEGGKDDGVLTALEATGLNLWGTKLVVLSACDTGLGEVRNGEGVYGLRRAFVLAGAESLVMSLWPAVDYSTRELMTAYYKNLKQGFGRGDALRRAQLDLLRRSPHLHPFYWANFIQSGEWANLNGQR